MRFIIGILAAILLTACSSRELDKASVYGEYSSGCCSLRVSQAGIEIPGQKPVPFSLKRDNVSFFLLPQNTIKVSGDQLVVEGGIANYIRVSYGPSTMSIGLFNKNENTIVFFEKVKSNAQGRSI